jgi:hypothetical protein
MPIRDRQRRRGGRCGRAQIGDEIANGEVGFMTDAADNWDSRLQHGARDRFLVESPKILDRPAAAADDEHVDLGALARRGDGRRDLESRPVALHRRRIQDHRQCWHPALERRQDVGERRGARRRDKADRARESRQRTLALCAEPTGGLELGLESGELLVARADTRQPHGFDI